MTTPHWASALDILGRLIAFPTVSSQSNLDCVDWIAGYLRQHGVSSQLVFNDEGTKANLFATIGPADRPGIVLSGHTDVVPAADQAWQTDPFVLTRRDGRLYGRGTTDMKGFVAAVLAMVPQMVAAQLTTPIHIALSYDEEVGQFGAPLMIEAMAKQIARPQAVIVGEPTRLHPVIGHKGSLVFYTDVTGRTYHSSRMDLGVSAIHTAARLITWLDERMAQNKAAAAPNGFEPPYTTLHCGIIHGGHASNVIADSCRFITEIRTIPGEDPVAYQDAYRAYIAEAILPGMRAIAPEADVVLTLRSLVPGLAPNPGGPAERLVREVSGNNGPALCVTYGTEAGQFQAAGWDAIICGPGDIAQAHQADEFLEESEFARCLDFLGRLVERCR